MAIIKCKMCGGELNIVDASFVAECEYCGTKQTIPALDDDKKLKMFERANKLRATCEFDKASGIYESIVEDYPEEAEAYWGLILCKYGIEYVDDPATGNKIPTCHRSSFDSVMDDPNFELVMENADSIAVDVYRNEAKQIEEIRKGIIQVSNQEQPYDIFICYKETDENGERTVDSVIAQDVYKELTREGYRVFFSRITLEDKLGQEYEPYIFAALNSAKVMLAFGTDYKYYNAVWVKNEWSRYLKLIAAGQKKTLIPCYKGIDAYDMPKEFARLQAQDMDKIGAIQDLLHGIEKLIGKKNSQQTVVQMTGNTGANLSMGNMYLNEGSWEKADENFKQAIANEGESADAYLGMFLAKHQYKSLNDIKTQTEANLDCVEPKTIRLNFDKKQREWNSLWQCACGCVNYVDEPICYNCSVTKRELEEVDEASLIEKAEENDRKQKMAETSKQKDAKKKKVRKIVLIASAVVLVIVAIVAGLIINSKVIVPKNKYEDAKQYLADNKFEEAYNLFVELGDYKDAQEQQVICKYNEITYYLDNGMLEEAGPLLNTFKSDERFAQYVDECSTKYSYVKGKASYEDGDYKAAITTLNPIKDYEDAEDIINDAKYQYVVENKHELTDLVESYVEDLCEINYPGIQAVYDELYTLKVEFHVSTSENDTNSNMSSVSKYDTRYYHFVVTGFEKYENLDLSYIVYYTDGSVGDGEFEWSLTRDNNAAWIYVWFDTPAYAYTGAEKVELYNKNTGELLGTKTIQITN